MTTRSRDADYMRLALNLAMQAKGRTPPNPLVGAVIVRDGKIMGKGFHRHCGGDHAEVIALKHAGALARGATMYVTLEPCSHYGRTPPCVDQIIKKGIKEVIVGMVDPNPVNNGKSILKLKRSGIRTKVGFLKRELQAMNETFIKFIKYKMPFVVVKCAQTLDGKIATAGGQSKWITSQGSRDFAYRLRNDFDAIMVGINTVLKDDPRLNAADKTKRIKKVIVDTTLQIPLRAKLFKNTRPQDIIVAAAKRVPKGKLNQLLKKGVSVIVCPQRRAQIDLKRLLKELAKKEIASILVEGGSKITGSLLKERIVDKMMFFVAPKILGSQEAVSSVRGLKVNHVSQAVLLKDVTVRKIASDILIEGYVRFVRNP